MKYYNIQTTFQEFPYETTVAINITNCPNHCPGCHSQHLWEDIGEELTPKVIDKIWKDYKGCFSCIGIMGGDASWDDVYDIAMYIKEKYPMIKIGWYSGKNYTLPKMWKVFDYIKIGPYVEKCGDLTQPTTNQQLFKKMKNGQWVEITPFYYLSRTSKAFEYFKKLVKEES